jgi:hypothetical protein
MYVLQFIGSALKELLSVGLFLAPSVGLFWAPSVGLFWAPQRRLQSCGLPMSSAMTVPVLQGVGVGQPLCHWALL